MLHQYVRQIPSALCKLTDFLHKERTVFHYSSIALDWVCRIWPKHRTCSINGLKEVNAKFLIRISVYCYSLLGNWKRKWCVVHSQVIDIKPKQSKGNLFGTANSVWETLCGASVRGPKPSVDPIIRTQCAHHIRLATFAHTRTGPSAQQKECDMNAMQA